MDAPRAYNVAGLRDPRPRPACNGLIALVYHAGIARVGYRRRVTLRRESPIRGRRLRLDEALMERALMSPAGYRFLLHVAPRIDKVVIPRTHGRLSSAGIDRVGLVTTTGAKSGLARTQPPVLIDDSDGLLAIGQLWSPTTPGLERQPAGAPRMHRRVHGSAGEVPRRAAHRRRARLGMGHGHRLLRGLPRYRASCAPREIRLFRLKPFA